MISVERLNGDVFYINVDLIEFIEKTPDTVITTVNGKKLVVKDTVEEIIDKIKKYKKEVFSKHWLGQ